MGQLAANRIGRIMGFLFCLAGVSIASAQSLRYQFKSTTQPVYDVTIRIEQPDGVETRSGTISYEILSVDPANGQVTFRYATALQTKIAARSPQRIGPPSIPSPWGPSDSPRIVMDPLGKIVRSNRMSDGDQLPWMLGYSWQLLLPPLPPDDQPVWKTGGPIGLTSSASRWPPGPPWQQSSQVQRSAEESITCTRGERRGNIQPLQRHYELVSAEKSGNTPLLKETGDTQILFDVAGGLVQSLEMKKTVELADNNVSVRIPIEVKARLLTEAEAAEFQARRKAELARLRAESEKRRAQNKEKERAEPENTPIPVEAVKTPMVGREMGKAFTLADAEKRPVLGFRYMIKKIGRSADFSRFEPIFSRNAPGLVGDELAAMAKKGYVVGGLMMQSGMMNVEAIRVVFMRMDESGKLNPADTYMSAWIGNHKPEVAPAQLAGKGEKVIGIYGHKTHNLAGLGLVVIDDKQGE